jgi:imidazole glycerol-phosphate synthase subunit HisF
MTKFRPRIIPTLLIDGLGLVKTVRFRDRKYLGDPVNTVRIFNEKGADELILLDINATAQHADPQFDLLEEIASESFMPLGYGGGIKSVEQIRRILSIGYEKVVLNTNAYTSPTLVSEAAAAFGRQAVVVSVDVRRPRIGSPEVRIAGASQKVSSDPAAYCAEMEARGAGELFVTSIDRDGGQKGFDLDLITQVSKATRVPVVASGGAGQLSDFRAAIDAGASACAAGSMFVFNGRHRAVLITYPTDGQLEQVLRR